MFMKKQRSASLVVVVEWLVLLILWYILPLARSFSPLLAMSARRQKKIHTLLPATSTTVTTQSFEPQLAVLPEGITKQQVLRTKEVERARNTATTVTEQPIFPRLGDIITVEYVAYAIGDTTNNHNNTTNEKPRLIARSPVGQPQQMVLGDSSMIPGWEYGLSSMQVGESCILTIDDPELAYGTMGVPPIVPPNATLEIHVKLLSATPASANIDFDALAEADATPRTAADIAAAYAFRQANRVEEEPLEGLAWWIRKVQSFYFYGLFEGETGERPPWFLRPSITFPLAFVICGAAFAVSLLSGAITERGAPVKDELDEIILSSALVQPMMMMMMMIVL